MAETVARRSSLKGPKRRNERNILTFYEKIAVIHYYDETNISRNSLAKMFHCCATQIRRILERKEELMQQLATLSEADASIIIEEMTRKRRKFEMSAISFILHQWVERCRQLRLRKSITNETLKETALKMAAILNLPAFRPSYRWLNRFRGKYKYNEQDLGAAANGVEGSVGAGELAVEDIIIEFKDSLPSFMQKEISAVTSLAKVDIEVRLNDGDEMDMKRADVPVFVNENSADFGDDDSEDEADEEADNDNKASGSKSESPPLSSSPISDSTPPDTTLNPDESLLDGRMMNAGTSALLNSVFPHLAVIHQFALLNADVKALELISQLGVHMQSQAIEGAYKQLSLASSNTNSTPQQDAEMTGSICADIDDIVLIE